MEDVDESYFDWSDEDDIICSSKYISSDEDDDVDATINAHRKFGKRGGESVFGNNQKPKHRHHNNDDEEDDFEKEMASELSLTMRHLTSSLGVPGSSGASRPAAEETKKAAEFYDDVYFDSDESEPEETTPGQASNRAEQNRRHHRKVLTNDELFYDPTMDDRDQAWVDQKRRSYQPRGRRPGRMLGVENNNTIQLPPSDAVLNCPACLTTLCMDCQRHEVYQNQYRAMFVFNCVVDVTERLSYPSKDQKRQQFLKNKKAKKKKNVPQEEDTKGEGEGMKAEEAASTVDPAGTVQEVQNSQPTSSTGDSAEASSAQAPNMSVPGLEKDKFHPVMCKICNTKVAVYDADEVYHFFNVVTSY